MIISWNCILNRNNKVLNSSKNFIQIKTEKIYHSKNSKRGELTIKILPYFNIKNVTLLILLNSNES